MIFPSCPSSNFLHSLSHTSRFLYFSTWYVAMSCIFRGSLLLSLDIITQALSLLETRPKMSPSSLHVKVSWCNVFRIPAVTYNVLCPLPKLLLRNPCAIPDTSACFSRLIAPWLHELYVPRCQTPVNKMLPTTTSSKASPLAQWPERRPHNLRLDSPWSALNVLYCLVPRGRARKGGRGAAE